MTSTPTPSDIVQQAREMQPRIRELGATIERERRLPMDLVEEFRKAGFFHMLLPAEYGGLQANPLDAARVVEEVAAADGSAGWCLMIAAQNETLVGMVPPEQARQLFTERQIMCGTARPIGKAVVNGDQVTVTGRWPFASGSSHADWFGAECVVYDGDTPRKAANGENVTRMLVVPANEVRIHDTWDTTGLRGTASNDFSVDGAVVPWARGFQMLVDPPLHPWRLYHALPLCFMNHGTHSLGIARGAIQGAKEMAVTKVGYGSDRPIREHPRFQQIIAEATALVESARVFLYQAAGELWTVVDAGGEGTPLQRARVRLAASHAARASLQAVDLLHAALGTNSVFTKNPIERQFRDIHTAGAHVMIGLLTLEAAGRVEMDLEAQFPFF